MAVYLDYNATTPLAPQVIDAITGSMRDHWANPSSNYTVGKESKAAIEKARGQVAKLIGGASENIVFTSGGTESNNIVFNCILREGEVPHVITSTIEHDSVIKPLNHLKDNGSIELTCVKPVNGYISVSDVMNSVKSNTRLISIMLANNETGAIQPVKEIGEVIRLYNINNNKIGQERILIHTDAAQALGKISVDVQELKVDYLTIVGHKFYGPRIGGLYIKGLTSNETPYKHFFAGGGQERGYRPGTENTPMIVGLGTAAQLVSDRLIHHMSHLRSICEYLRKRLKEKFDDGVHFNSSDSDCLPNTCNFSLTASHLLQGPVILRHLKSSQISLGAACHSHDTFKASFVLLESGVSEDIALNALRVSVGRETTRADIDIFINDLSQAVNDIIIK
ncbi:PREDICTED: selenocysteine lyase-like [Amphimedon queenslandica]|uniref:Selenocysteine lyase n=1 Tax=Amphimedon queenslandica TaxID=400682 RepID=A0A1X7UVC9_AMPQE|nr:PREDICTED: selenocysteine lyase-like [Amphimedon queenslandica]|eukprot:XP_003386612.1 PREDICTED: selenocysteine lyase-like [Amphimedon queenslandica]